MSEPDQNRALLIVAGSGRSGTSVFSTAVHRLGLHIPQPEIAANNTNPRGFGEPKWAVEFHERVMKRVHVRFEDTRPDAWESAATITGLPGVADELKAWLEEQFAIADRVAVKDPRLTWFTDLYAGVSSTIPARMAVATMLRHPIETTKSRQLHYGEGVSATSRLAAWINQMLELEQRTRQRTRALVRYDAMLADWRAELARADEQLGLNLLSSASRAQQSEVDDLIEPSLRRALSSWDDLGVPRDLARLAEDSWEALLQVAATQGGDQTSAFADVDELVSAYHEMYGNAREIARSAILAARDDERARQQAKHNQAAPATRSPGSTAPTRPSVIPPERSRLRGIAATTVHRTLDRLRTLRGQDTTDRVAILVLSANERSGVTTTMINLANGLAAAGHEVELISLFRMGEHPRLPVDSRVRLTYLEDIRRPADLPGQTKPFLRARDNPLRHETDRALDRRPSRLMKDTSPTSQLTDLLLERRLSTLRPGILISNRPMLHKAAARYAPKHVRIVAVEHATFVQRGEGILQVYKEAAPRLDALVTLTVQDQAAYRDLLGDTRVDVIPNAVANPGTTVSPLDSQVIMAAGELIGRKGFDRLIDAFAPLVASHPDWRLEIYGQGAQHEELQKQITELGVGENVELMGFHRDFQDRLSRASVYAMTSRFEAFPMVLLEAMSMGVPVISFDCPNGPRNLITDGKDGLLVPDGDIVAFTKGLESLMDPAYRAELSHGALETIAGYDITAIVRRWEQLFAEVR